MSRRSVILDLCVRATRGGRGDFGGNFVGIEREQRIARAHVIALLAVPERNDSRRDRLPDGGDLDVRAAHAKPLSTPRKLG